MTLRRPRRAEIQWRARLIALVALALLVPATEVLAAAGGPITGHVRVSPLVVRLDLSATTAPVGQAVGARATVTNVGSSLVRDIQVELRADPVGLRVTKPIVKIAQLKAGKSTVVSWSICGAVPGSYVVLVRTTESGASIDSAGRVLTITPGAKKAC